MKTKRMICLMAFLVMGAMGVRGDVLVAWENNHLAGDEASTTAGEAPSAGSFDAGLLSAPVLSRGAGAIATSFTDTFGFRSGNEVSLADAIADNRYLTWTVTPGAGNQISYDQISILGYSQDQAVNFDLFTSATGTFTAGNEIDSWTVPNNVAAANGLVNTTVVTGLTQLQNVTGAVEFRLYYWGKTSEFAQIGIGRAFAGSDTRNDLTVEGTISAIPEPSVLALLGIPLGVFMMYRRRKC